MASASPASNPNDDVGYQVVIATIVSMILAIGAVILRFWSRRIVGVGFALDDYFAATSLFFKLGIDLTGFIMINHGMGRHVDTVSPRDLSIFLKVLYTGSFLYSLTILFIKLSILRLYHRMFTFRYMLVSTSIVGSIVILWAASIFLIGIFECIPIKKAWDPLVPGRCIDLVQFYYGLQIPNIVTDIVILLLPLPTIWRLPINTKTRFSLAAMFTVGGLTAIFDIVRLVAMVHLNTTDVTYAAVTPAVWTDIEPGIAIFAACLPTLKPVIRKLCGNPTFQIQSDSSQGKNMSSTITRSTRNRNSGGHELKTQLCPDASPTFTAQ